MEQLFYYIKEGLISNTVVVEPGNERLTLFIFFVQWSALVFSAAACLYSARKHGMDRYGALMIAFIVSVAGGTIRDILLVRYPIFWISEPIYAFSVLAIFLLSLILGADRLGKHAGAAKVLRPVKQITNKNSRTFLILDSLALGLWVYLGCYYALLSGTPLIIAPIMGVITACFGGIIRDIFFARVPKLLMPGQLYTVTAAVGGVVYVVFWASGADNTTAFVACFVTTFAIRMISVKYNILSS